MPRCGKILLGRTQFWLVFFPTPYSHIFRLWVTSILNKPSTFISNIFNAYFLVTETPWNFDQSRATFQDQRGLVGELSKCCLNCARLMVGWFTRVFIFKGCLISKGIFNLVAYSQKVLFSLLSHPQRNKQTWWPQLFIIKREKSRRAILFPFFPDFFENGTKYWKYFLKIYHL